MSESSDGIAKGLGIGIHELLRYGYAGLLAFAVAGITFPEWMTARIEQLGSVVTPLVAIVLGAAIYTVYRHSVGELAIHALVKWVHKKCDSRREPSQPTCKYRYLEIEYRVDSGDSLDAFRLIRDADAGGSTRWSSFFREHSEVHILYLTFFELLFIATPFALAVHRWGLSASFLVASLFFIAIGLYADIRLNKRETAFLRRIEREEGERIRSLLEAAKYTAPRNEGLPPST
jgi:hypothetical protein